MASGGAMNGSGQTRKKESAAQRAIPGVSNEVQRGAGERDRGAPQDEVTRRELVRDEGGRTVALVENEGGEAVGRDDEPYREADAKTREVGAPADPLEAGADEEGGHDKETTLERSASYASVPRSERSRSNQRR